MNSPDTDELLSAYIDGLATPEDVARVESDPALLARAAELRSAAAAVGRPVPVPPADAAVAAALRQSSTAANVTAIATRTQPRNRQVLGVAAAAAVVAIAFLAGAVLLNLGDDSGSEDDLAASFENSDDSASLSDSAQDAVEAPPQSTAAAEAAEVPQTEEETAQEQPAQEQPAAETAGDASIEQAPSEAAAADSDEGADTATDDDAAEEGASEFAAEEAADIPEFPDAAALLTAVAAEELTPEETTEVLPCALESPADRPNSTPVVFRALLPEGAALVTGWQTSDGFEVDEFILIDNCTSVQSPGP